jgi:hypothetical protein
MPSSPAHAELLSLGLIAPDPSRPGHYTILDPGPVGIRLQQHFQALGSQHLAQAAAVPTALDALSSAYQLAHPRTGDGREYLVGLKAISDRMAPLLASCTEELLTAQPYGPRPAAQLSMSYQRDLAVLDRGAQMRTIYHHTVRSHPPTATWATVMTEHGAQIRTITSKAFPRTVIIDRRVAVLAVLTEWTGPGPEPERALFITDEALVRALRAIFGLLWEGALAWDGTPLVEVTAIQRAGILGLMAGDTLETIARRLDVNRRTVYVHLEKLQRAVGAESIPGLTYWWAKHEHHYPADDESASTAAE